jgi:cobalt/nickel transport system permease protein
MHLPDGSLDNLTCTVTTAMAAGATAYAVARARKSAEAWNPAKFGAVAAFIFAVQMVNYPVAQGVSGHMVGGLLAGALLGPWLGLLAMVLVLASQCLLAGDGGATTLGANILAMGVTATWGGALLRKMLTGAGNSPVRDTIAASVAAWGSIVLAGVVCATIWAAGSTAPLGQVLGPMLSIHARIGVGEALITALVLVAVQAWSQRTANTWARRGAIAALASAVGVAVLLAPWASASPDGLEHVAQAWTAWPEATLSFAPLPDYLLPGVTNELLATATAGAIGTLAVYAIARTGVTLCRAGAKTVGQAPTSK